MKKSIKIAVRGAVNIPLDQLEPFQGDLKTLAREEYEKLRKGILDDGFSFVFHVWQHEGRNFIIDGHQRRFTCSHMRDHEGYEIPDLPCALVEAKSFKEAKKKVLSGVAQFGKMTQKSLTDFMKDADIPFDEVVANFRFPEINMEKFLSAFSEESPLKTAQKPEAPQEEMRRASDAVRQVILFFASDQYEEFMEKANELREFMDSDNVSDILLEILREKHASMATK